MDNIINVELIQLEEVNNENIRPGIEYEIYQMNEETKKTIFGENKLILSENQLSFKIKNIIPYNSYDGMLSLNQKTELYIKSIKEHFDSDNDINLNISYNKEDECIRYNIDFISKDTDITKFISKLLGFEFMFEHKIETINKKIINILK